jgi:hypothetical protein
MTFAAASYCSHNAPPNLPLDPSRFLRCQSQRARIRTANEHFRARRDEKRQYAAVTERIIEQLEQGCAPWVLPWVTMGASNMPTYIVSERHYRGANVLILG